MTNQTTKKLKNHQQNNTETNPVTKNNLDREMTASSILKFALPSIVMMVIMSFYTIVDGMFVARLIGTAAFSAINIVYPLLSVIVGLGTMFGTGITAIVSIRLGEGRQREANENFTLITVFIILTGTVLSALALVFLKPLLYLMGANAQIYQYCYDYAFPLVFFFFANILQLQFQNLYVADGKPLIGLIMTAAGGIANVVLDYVFIAILDMGIAGAAVATGIGYSIPAVYGLFYFSLKKGGNLHFVKPSFNGRVIARTITNGSSEMVSNLSTSVTTFLFNIIMMRLIGQEGVAAISVVLYLDFTLVAVNLGYAIGTAPLFSYNYGYHHPENLKKLFRVSLRFCLAVGIIMMAATFVFKRQLASVFSTPGTYVFELTVTGLTVYGFSYLFKGYNIFASAMFTAYGNGKVSAILSFMRTLVFLAAAIISFSWLFGVDGVWFATPVAELLALGLSVFFTLKYRERYHYGGSRKDPQVGPAGETQ